MTQKLESAVPGTLIDMPSAADHIRERYKREGVPAYNPVVQYEKKGDRRDWARAILARLEAGESVTIAAELMAREALGLMPRKGREPGADG